MFPAGADPPPQTCSQAVHTPSSVFHTSIPVIPRALWMTG